MLYAFFFQELGVSLFGYITFRMAMAAFSAFALTLLLGPPTIAWLARHKIGEDVSKAPSPELAQAAARAGKMHTPTMGGTFLMGSLLAAVLLWARLDNLPVVLAVLLAVGMGAVGFVDDWKKLTIEKSKGLTPRAKMLGLSLAALGALLALAWTAQASGRFTLLALYPPFFKNLEIDLAHSGLLGLLGFVAFEWFVIVGTANGANIVDGMDGLAAGVLLISGLALSVFCYVTGRADFTSYLNLPHVVEASEMAVVGAALCGACLGFLWFNAYPAQVFMGDSGALPLGGILAWMAVVSKQELVLPLIAIVLVIDLGSSWLQTFYYRRSGGKRLFTLAPIHHGLERYGGVFQRRAQGLHEVKVVVRFWIVAVLGAVGALALMKVR